MKIAITPPPESCTHILTSGGSSTLCGFFNAKGTGTYATLTSIRYPHSMSCEMQDASPGDLGGEGTCAECFRRIDEIEEEWSYDPPDETGSGGEAGDAVP